MTDCQFVVNRNGKRIAFNVTAIKERIMEVASMDIKLEDAKIPSIDIKQIDVDVLVKDVASMLRNGMTTSLIDRLVVSKLEKQYTNSECCKLAARMRVANLKKDVMSDVRTLAETLYRHKTRSGSHYPRIKKSAYNFLCKYAGKLNEMLVLNRDYLYDMFGIETECLQYLLKLIDHQDTSRTDDECTLVAELPQHLHLRVAIQGEIKFDDDDSTPEADEKTLARIKRAYDLFSTFKATHATPTRCNSLSTASQLISCNLLVPADDQPGIMRVASEAAALSKSGAGLGVCMSNIRARGSAIKKTGGISEGFVLFARIYMAVMQGFNQRGTSRKGSMTITMAAWHPDISLFLDLKANTAASESLRARLLFTNVGLNDYFLERAKNNDSWFLLDPEVCPGLTTTYGDEFVALYNGYVTAGKYLKEISAMQLLNDICKSIIQTGGPYITFLDTMNRKSNQQGWATIQNLNLCCEVALCSGYVKPRPPPDTKYLSNPNLPMPEIKCEPNEQLNTDMQNSTYEIANCNLASIAVNRFLKELPGLQKPVYDFQALTDTAYFLTERLNNIMDFNDYNVKEAKDTNMRHRPIAIGIQGLQNLFFKLKLKWGSEKALELDAHIMEAILYGALSASTALAKKHGPYETYQRSPAAHGYLAPDLLEVEYAIRDGTLPDLPLQDLLRDHADRMPPLWQSKYNPEEWQTLREHIKKFGLRNSELTAPMPTASTSQIHGHVEAFYPLATHLFKRTTTAGEFLIVNDYVVEDLKKLGMWSDEMYKLMIAYEGSFQNDVFGFLPPEFRDYYKTASEYGTLAFVQHAAARGRFVTMSQSFNVWVDDPTIEKVGDVIIQGWQYGLKSIYYVRQNAHLSQNTAAPSHEHERYVDSIKKSADYTAELDYNPDYSEAQIDTCFSCGS